MPWWKVAISRCSEVATGVVLGRLGRDYLRHDGPEHVLCYAPTRSGKGVGLVVPTLLTWPASAIVHDIKGENWQLTAGLRSRFGRVLLFDPTNTASAAYNPLLEVRRGEWEVRDVQNVADVLVDPEGSLEKRNHWEKTSHALLVGAILHILYAGEDRTLAGVAAFLSDPQRPIDSTLRAMMTTPHLGKAGVHPVVASAARELLNKSENERSGVLSTAMSFLGLYRDPVVAKVTSRCDWRIADLVDGKHPRAGAGAGAADGGAACRARSERWDRTMTTKARLSVYLEPELMDALAAFADKRDRSRSLVAEAAIASFLSSDADERREAAVAKRLDRIERCFVQMERDGNIVIEMLALFVRSWLLNTPPVPESEKSAVRAQAADRYDAFVSALGRRLAMGPLVRDEVRQDADS